MTVPQGQGTQDESIAQEAGGRFMSAFSEISTKFEQLFGWIQANPERALLAGAVAIGSFIALRLLRALIASALAGLYKKKGDSWGSVVYRTFDATNSLFLASLAIYAGTLMIDGAKILLDVSSFLILVFGVLQIAFWTRAFVMGVVERHAHKSADPRSTFSNAIQIIYLLLNVTIFSLAALLIFDNLGMNVTALIAGLGIGGIAIGLAAQGIFQDLFSALSIVFDKPFQKGDFIIFGDKMGEVEQIGLKTTRIRSLSGEQIVIGNTNLLDKEIRNYKRMRRRRIQFRFGLVYQTTAEQLKEATRLVKEIIDNVDKATFDRAHFFDFGESSLDFEVIYFVEDPDYNTYMGINQDIKLQMQERFAEAGLDFAYPTRTLHLATPKGEPVHLEPS